MNNKTLVAYYTKEGASEHYAKVIAENLRENRLEVDCINLKDEVPDVRSYDTIIVGTGVKMFMVYRRWKKVLKQKTLKDKRLFLFLSSGTAIKEPEKAVEKFLKPLVNKYSLNAVSLISFPGIIPEKWIQPSEEKDTLKPEKAKTWAREIATTITKKTVSE